MLTYFNANTQTDICWNLEQRIKSVLLLDARFMQSTKLLGMNGSMEFILCVILLRF